MTMHVMFNNKEESYSSDGVAVDQSTESLKCGQPFEYVDSNPYFETNEEELDVVIEQQNESSRLFDQYRRSSTPMYLETVEDGVTPRVTSSSI